MHQISLATLLALLCSATLLAAGPCHANTDAERSTAGERAPGKPHQPTSINAPRQP
ncbi:hypothetical protein [Pseudomonas sp. SO81]|uniref:hypothetical protein n=1 Tax=Pseudomonas sp. SO81 TaxID=2983246 RepID=UPI0025A35CB3|nr:hypothetical protein [Pseudomonas sp. SO81]WJN60018.1 hypothetical protein OH686_14785 [Pseudomonas sp. SO81]